MIHLENMRRNINYEKKLYHATFREYFKLLNKRLNPFVQYISQSIQL